MEPYLHQLLPPVLTCVVGKKLSAKSSEDHWALRDFAARLAGDVCTKHGRSYASLQSRITKTLVQALLDTERPLPTHYGAIVGLSTMGSHVLDVILMPNLEPYIHILAAELGKSSLSRVRKHEIARVYGAIMAATGQYLHKATDASTPMDIDNDHPVSANGATSSEDNKQAARMALALRQEVESTYSSLYEEFGDALVPNLRLDQSSDMLVSTTV
eukprot:Plantae.Rhodophyta-Rhodochaete_pulchella.ctg4683.p1 GENE.Plantae.Rhodophyta-Rhodochaete_pulchella.ctg4683~~Plantae.Rhodophyta-Rhodochaete_pulchella.ctg4683.p1  ORF type:complete len:251 (-),score=30.64 Plantae.Rhodophyta-Rhodochaete_pulchella.ctg4683:1282-1926(-)